MLVKLARESGPFPSQFGALTVDHDQYCGPLWLMRPRIKWNIFRSVLAVPRGSCIHGLHRGLEYHPEHQV